MIILSICIQNQEHSFSLQIMNLWNPLIEAKYLNLPVLAGELDYIRDLIDPIQTFDPNSSISIYRAVKRFLNVLLIELQY